MEKTTDQQYVLAGDGSKTPVVNGVSVPYQDYGGANVAGPGGVQAKQGHKCCGGCCDVRRATIIVNLISIGLGVLGILALVTLTTVQMDPDQYDDDEMKAAMEEMEGVEAYGGSIALAVVITVARLALNGLGIWGALSYTVWPVGASAVAFALEFLMALISFNLIGLVASAFFLYPHVYLIMEMRNGIMTKETYPYEKHSCCCV